MVYSSELGYDPDEWEECPDEEHRMLFGFFTRMLLSLFAVGSTVFLLWFMEARKQWAKAAKECKEPVFVETVTFVEILTDKNISQGKALIDMSKALRN